MVNKIRCYLIVGYIACCLTGCSGVSSQDRTTLASAGIGANSGYAATGNGWGTAAGATGGGYIGRQLSR